MQETSPTQQGQQRAPRFMPEDLPEIECDTGDDLIDEIRAGEFSIAPASY